MHTARMEKFRDTTTLTILIIFLYQEVGTGHGVHIILERSWNWNFTLVLENNRIFPKVTVIFELSWKFEIFLKVPLKSLKIIKTITLCDLCLENEN